jgi:hypothetical protein
MVDERIVMRPGSGFPAARSLQRHLLLTLGIGMGWPSSGEYVLTEPFLPHPARGGLAIGASIVGFLGIGNLIYYAITGKKET